MCPFKIESEIIAKLGESPKDINTNGTNKFLIETKDEKQSMKMNKLNKVFGNECQITKHHRLNSSQVLIYIYEYDIEDTQSFESGLKSKYPVSKVIPATWLKPRDVNARALLVTFNLTNPPDKVRISCERPTKVFRYYDRPMLRSGSLGYGHTVKR